MAKKDDQSKNTQSSFDTVLDTVKNHINQKLVQKENIPKTNTFAVYKRSLSWLYLSQVQKRAITGIEWYQPRCYLQASTIQDDALDHTVYTHKNPISYQTITAVEKYLDQHNSRTFLVMHKGELVHSSYTNFDKDSVFNSMSMIKTITALCIGIAIDKGFIADKDVPAYEFLPEWQNDKRKHITIDHLLTMLSGLKTDLYIGEGFVMPIKDIQFDDDIETVARAMPCDAPPNTRFIYNNYNSQLLGIILEKATGMSYSEFVHKYLWEPLGCGEAFTWVDDKGMARTFGGMFARPVDWLKIGELIRNKGYAQGKQLVSTQWVELMMTPANTAENGVKKPHYDYGRQLWLRSHAQGVIAGMPKIEGYYTDHEHIDDSIVYLEGLRGQYVFISPKHELVVLRIGERPNSDWDCSKMINMIIADITGVSCQQ